MVKTRVGRRWTDEQKAKVSASLMGRKVSAETRVKISATEKETKSHIVTHASPETRAKMSAAMMGNKYALGHSHPQSPEVRAKMSVASQGNTRGHGNWKGGRDISHPKRRAKHRTLGFVPLNQPFDGAEGHHVSKEYVVYIPRDLHKSVWHNVWTGKNMEQINILALGYLVRQLEAAA